MNDSYPPLPGAGDTPPEKTKAAPGATKPAGGKATATPVKTPVREFGGSIAGLANAAFKPPVGGVPPRRTPPLATGDDGDDPGPVVSARPTVPTTGLDALRRATRPASDSRPTTPPSVVRAPVAASDPSMVGGRVGGLPRWDDLRGRLRRVLDPDDPLFEMVNVLEASELAVHDELRVFRAEAVRLLTRLDDCSEVNGEARDHAEQAVRVSTDTRDLLEQTVVPLLQELLQRTQVVPVAPAPPPAMFPTVPAAALPEGWWVRIGRFLGAV